MSRNEPRHRHRGNRRDKSRASGANRSDTWLTEALADLLSFKAPADLTLNRFFRRHKAIGRRDRGLVADRCFDVLRQRRLYGHLAESGPNGPLVRRLAVLADRHCQYSILTLTEEENQWLERIGNIDIAGLSEPLQFSLPDWFAQQMGSVLSNPADLGLLGRSLLEPAPLTLRTNLMKTRPADLVKRLADDQIQTEPASCWAAPATALDVIGHPALERTGAFTEGQFEVQDAGSQLMAALAAPRRGETVVDFCAGAGGKALAMGALMRSSGQVYACDISARRLARMRPRLARSGITNIQPMRIDSEHDKKLNRLRERADLVLVDAPCSGSGTWRRNPDLKWRNELTEVHRLTSQQSSILAAAAALVKPGGRLMYVTCSFLTLENEAIAIGFEGDHPDFERQDLMSGLTPPAGSDARPAMPDGVGFLRLWPHLDHCDGFFAAQWVRSRG